jgi:glycosyltransferase involved in cell wall biosynthesis
MKILYLISGTNMGGATFSFLTLVNYIKDNREDPYVVIPDNNPTFIKLLSDNGIPFFVAPLFFFCYPSEKKGIKNFFHLLHMFFREALAEIRLNRIIKKVKPDIIHTNVGPLATGHFIAKRNKIPHIWHIREYGDKDFNIQFFPSKNFFHKILAQDTTICATSDLRKYNKLETNKNAFVVYNGVRSKLDICFQSNKEKFFLCASRISPEKGFEDTISTFSLFKKKHPEYKLIILGDGNINYVDRLKALAQSLGSLSSIEFKGFSKDVSQYMRKATALLVNSHSEGFGRMTAEANFDGCIVIGKDSGGTHEILSQTGGFLYKTQEEMLSCMEHVISMAPEEYHAIAEKAQKKAQILFSTEQYTCNIYSIYKQILNTAKAND